MRIQLFEKFYTFDILKAILLSLPIKYTEKSNGKIKLGFIFKENPSKRCAKPTVNCYRREYVDSAQVQIIRLHEDLYITALQGYLIYKKSTSKKKKRREYKLDILIIALSIPRRFSLNLSFVFT